MKRIVLALLLFLPCLLQATSYTSVGGGGNWSNSATWSPTGVPGSGDDATIASAVTLDANESVNNITINSSQTFTVSGANSLSVYGNFTNNGTFTCSTGLVSFVGSSNQTITGLTTFYNLTSNPSSSSVSVILANAITISNNFAISNGTFNCQNLSITGNTTGTMTMSSGTTLILGETVSSVLPGFPSNYTGAHTTLNSSSTVIYQANNTSTGQTVSAVPNYGNLTITTSKAGTPSVSYFIVRGNLTIGSGITFTQNAGTDSIKGNYTINSGALVNDYASNTYFSGGTFTNNGTYKEFSSEAFTFNGSMNQYLIGASGPINSFFNQVTDHATATTDTLFVKGNMTTQGSSGMIVYSTVFVPASINDTIRLTNYLANWGTFTALSGVVYLDGAIGTGNGSFYGNSPTFYNFTTSGADLIPGINWTVTSNFTILSGQLDCSSGGTLHLDGNWINNGSTSLVVAVVKMEGTQNAYIEGTTPTKFGVLYINKSASTDTVKLKDSVIISTTYGYDGLQIMVGTFDVSTSNYSITDGGYFENYGTFVARKGTVNMNGSNTGEDFYGGSPTTFYNLLINNTSGLTLTVGEAVSNNFLIGSSCSFDVSTSNYSLSVGGNFTNNGTFTHRSGTVTLNGTSAQTIGGSSTTTFYNLTCNSTGTDAIAQSKNVIVSNNFLVSGGTFTWVGSNNSLDVAGSFTNNGTLTANSGRVIIDGSAAQTLGGSSKTTFYNLTLYDGHTVTLGNNETTKDSLVINSGTTLDVSTSNYSMTVGGNWADYGTFTYRTGLVTFNANGSQCVIRSSGTETFKNMTIASTSRLGVSPPTAISVSGLVTIQPGGHMDCSCP